MRARSVLFALGAAVVPCKGSIGLTGIDDWPNEPFCATACYGSLSSYRLDCSEIHGDPHSHDAMVMTSPDCRADHVPFLTSLAWCISTKCQEVGADLKTSEIEKFWEEKSTGDASVEPVWSYREALANVTEKPTTVLEHGGEINETVVPPEFWFVLYGTYRTLDGEGRNMNIFGLVLLNVGFGLPILLSWSRFIPGISLLYDKIRPYVVYPSLVGRYHVRPLPFSLGNAPTVGQGLYIFVMIVLNIVLSAINFKTAPAHLWFQNKSQQVAGYLMYRTGVLSFAMAPLVFLFSGRNNFLQWITNWPHSTFLLLHRWIARLFVLQALLHTVLAVGVYSKMGIYEAEVKLPYWAWGVVATLVACVMLVVSTLFFRKLAYEVFLLSHIIMAILVIIGSWYHVVLRFEIMSGHTMWLWTASAVWFFDRVVRILRMIRTGSRRARVTDIGEGYVRVDIDHIRWGSAPGQKVYVYFPSIHPMRPWENHPFSVLPTSIFSKTRPLAEIAEAIHTHSGSDSPSHGIDVEKRSGPVAAVSPREVIAEASGISLFIRKSAGMTKFLRAHDNLLTLLEGPYPNTSNSAILGCDRVVLIAGGIGITGILPWASAHHNVELFWSVKQNAECLVEALEPALDRITEKNIKIGSRTDIEAVITREAALGWERVGVVACGPAGLCDDVRAVVASLGRERRTVFELEVDAYTW